MENCRVNSTGIEPSPRLVFRTASCTNARETNTVGSVCRCGARYLTAIVTRDARIIGEAEETIGLGENNNNPYYFVPH